MKKLILGVILLIGVGVYFGFFFMSDAKARDIIRQDFYKDQKEVCDGFFVLNENSCFTFASCYIGKAINAIPNKMLVPIAREIKNGNSSAIQTFKIIDGKQIGRSCL